MNVERFKQVLDYIHTHPENWDQAYWHCGTTHCFAGIAELLMDSKTKSNFETWEIAEKWLELNEYQSDWLFDSTRTLEDFKRCLKMREVPEDDQQFDNWGNTDYVKGD